MEIITNPTKIDIQMAAKSLKDGHLVAFPTETVYGLGADANNERAVSRIYSVKGRPTNHPLIVHISSIDQLEKWTIDIPEYAINLAKEYWPGPLTLILKRSPLSKNFITGSQESVGVRVPAHHLALDLLFEFEKLGGLGIAAPSANRYGAVSPTNGFDVLQELGTYLGNNDLIIDGGASAVGIESTIVDCTKSSPNILRPGIVTENQIRHFCNLSPLPTRQRSNLRVPGMVESHYKPFAKVVLSGVTMPGDGFYALANIPTPPGSIRMGSPIDVYQYATQLYSILRRCDSLGLEKIRFEIPEGNGIAEAIRDRLVKASTSN